MSFIQEPLKWNSVFRPIVYEFNYPTANFSSVTNIGGFAKFNLTTIDIYGLSAVRRIYISSGIYAGWHIVTTTTSTSITTSTIYSATTTGTLDIIDDVQFEIYVGYTTGQWTSENPERIIATIQPNPNLTAQLRFDVSAYLKAAWANDGYMPMIAPPVNGNDGNMSTPFRVATLGRGANDGTTYYALYSTIESGLLNSFDVDGTLLSVQLPVVFSCGCSIISQVVDTVIYNNITCDGTIYDAVIKKFQDGEPFYFQDSELYEFN